MNDMAMREVPSYPGYYADYHGNIYHNNTRLSIGHHNGVYGYVSIKQQSATGKWYNKRVTVARLMGEAWLSATPNDFVCFVDGDNTNLELSNLYLGNRSEFSKNLYEFRKNNNMDADKRLQLRSMYDCVPVYQLDASTYQIVNKFDSIKQASETYDVQPQQLGRCCYDIDKTCLNHRWCFQNNYSNLISNLVNERGDANAN